MPGHRTTSVIEEISNSMMMHARRYDIALAVIGLSLLSSVPINASEDCDPKLCPGPLYYYEELGCLPIYEDTNSCCPIRYNCDHWKNFGSLEHKCFVHGHVYERGEILRQGETNNPCDIYTCRGGESDFEWSLTSCPDVQNSSCYFKRTPFQCCGTIEVCPEKEEDRPTCDVSGVTYKDGEPFSIYSDTTYKCYCGEGYKVENVESFCVTAKPSWCENTISSISKIRQQCAPVYASRLARNSCNIEFRCYQEGDFVLRRQMLPHQRSISSTYGCEDPNMWCRFGNLTMSIGEELGFSNDDTGVHTECVCEVPPLPTCYWHS